MLLTSTSVECKRRYLESFFNCSYPYHECQWGPKAHCMDYMIHFMVKTTPRHFSKYLILIPQKKECHTGLELDF